MEEETGDGDSVVPCLDEDDKAAVEASEDKVKAEKKAAFWALHRVSEEQLLSFVYDEFAKEKTREGEGALRDLQQCLSSPELGLCSEAAGSRLSSAPTTAPSSRNGSRMSTKSSGHDGLSNSKSGGELQEKQKHAPPIYMQKLSRSDPIPCPQTGKRSGAAQDREIRVYVWIPASGDQLNLWCDPDLPLGPPSDHKPDGPMERVWGPDHGAQQPASRTSYPAQEQGPWAALLCLPQEKAPIQASPSPSRKTNPGLGFASPSPPRSTLFGQIAAASLQQAAATPATKNLLGTEATPGSANPLLSSCMKSLVNAKRREEAAEALRECAERRISLVERFRAAANVIRAEVRETIVEAENPHGSLKGMIHKACGVPPERQMLLIDSKSIGDDQRSLRQCGVGHGGWVTLIAKKAPRTLKELKQGRGQFLATTARKNQQLHSSSFVVGRMAREGQLNKPGSSIWVQPKWQHDHRPRVFEKEGREAGSVHNKFALFPPYYKDYEYIGARKATETIRERFCNGEWSTRLGKH